MLLASAFNSRTPDSVLAAAEAFGLRLTGLLFQLNSMENRVYELELEVEPRERCILKIYRPERWTYEQIAEEHAFLHELHQAGLPVLLPIPFHSSGPSSKSSTCDSLLEFEGFYHALFKKFAGRMPDELSLEDLKSIGRKLAQIHNIGAKAQFSHRPHWSEGLSEDLDLLETLLPSDLKDSYLKVAQELVSWALSENYPHSREIRIHGDLHRGNILRDSQGQMWIVDFDDSRMGLPEQDLWMLASDESDYEALLEGYGEFRDIGDMRWEIGEGLRGLRLIRFSAWIARRWEDASFPSAFPHFGSSSYWYEELKLLNRCVEALA